MLVFTTSLALAQENATQQQIEKLSGQLQDLLETQARDGKRLDALEKKISDLAEKVNTPQVNDSASRDELKALAGQVQEIEQKRKADRELILKEIDKASRSAAGTPTRVKNTTPAPAPPEDPTPAGPQKGYYYTVRPGDSLGAIVKAYRDQGVKVTKAQIIAANPKMNPEVLIADKKIFIPDPNAK